MGKIEYFDYEKVAREMRAPDSILRNSGFLSYKVRS